MKRIILTGGGTAGHVTPNIALLPKLKELGYDGKLTIEREISGEQQLKDIIESKAYLETLI